MILIYEEPAVVGNNYITDIDPEAIQFIKDAEESLYNIKDILE